MLKKLDRFLDIAIWILLPLTAVASLVRGHYGDFLVWTGIILIILAMKLKPKGPK